MIKKIVLFVVILILLSYNEKHAPMSIEKLNNLEVNPNAVYICGVLHNSKGQTVEGFVSFEGYQGAPGIIVGEDGIFIFELDKSSLENRDYTLYVFEKGFSGWPAILLNPLSSDKTILNINVETKMYEISDW